MWIRVNLVGIFLLGVTTFASILQSTHLQTSHSSCCQLKWTLHIESPTSVYRILNERIVGCRTDLCLDKTNSFGTVVNDCLRSWRSMLIPYLTTVNSDSFKSSNTFIAHLQVRYKLRSIFMKVLKMFWNRSYNYEVPCVMAWIPENDNLVHFNDRILHSQGKKLRILFMFRMKMLKAPLSVHTEHLRRNSRDVSGYSLARTNNTQITEIVQSQPDDNTTTVTSDTAGVHSNEPFNTQTSVQLTSPADHNSPTSSNVPSPSKDVTFKTTTSATNGSVNSHDASQQSTVQPAVQSDSFDSSITRSLVMIVAISNVYSRPAVFGSLVGLMIFSLLLSAVYLLWDGIKNRFFQTKSRFNSSGAVKSDEMQLTDSGNVSQNVSTSSNELQISANSGSASNDANRVASTTKPALESALSIESLFNTLSSLSKDNNAFSLTITCGPQQQTVVDKSTFRESQNDSNGSRRDIGSLKYAHKRRPSSDDMGYNRLIIPDLQHGFENNVYDEPDESDMSAGISNLFKEDYINVISPESFSPSSHGNSHASSSQSGSYVNTDTFLVRGSTLRSSLV